jgi:tetratricopeptide (TPR) repeat protein
MLIEQRAGNVAFKLANAGLGTRPIVFITHSMGGLIVKSLIVESQTLPDQDRKRIVQAIRGIVFCGTPHRGSAMAMAAGKLEIYFSCIGAYLAGFLGWTVAGILGRLIRAQAHMKEIEANSKPLDFLHDKFIEWQDNSQIPVDTYAENQPLSRFLFLFRLLDCGVVVPRASANSGIAKCVVHDVDDDHLSLVKPRDRKHDVYSGVLYFVTNALEPSSGFVTFKIKLPDNFGTFTDEKLKDLVELLSKEAAVLPSEIVVMAKRAGSINIDFQLSEEAASKLLEKFATGQGVLRDRGIIKVDASMLNKNVYLRRFASASWAFVGRETELSYLNQILDQDQIRVVTVVAAGGIGKTTLIANWLSQLAARGWAGFEAVFDWSFYSQGSREQVAPSSDLFLTEALTFFGDETLAKSSQSAFDKGRRLSQLVEERRALLVLDGLEPLQYSPASPTAGELKDQGITALLKGLVTSSQSLCVITTRHRIPDLHGYRGDTVSEIPLQRLNQESGVALLRSLGVNGNDEEFVKLVDDMQGHALSLQLLGSYLHDVYDGDIRRRDQVKLDVSDFEEQGGHAFRVMDAYVQSLNSKGEYGQRAHAILCLLGFFDRPAAGNSLEALLQPPAIAGLTESLKDMSKFQRDIILTRLEASKFISVNQDGAGILRSLDAHPLLREYFAAKLRDDAPDAWAAGHRRLFEHLCHSTKEGEQPTLEALQPLYQAVAHGCQASLHQETFDKVYFARILRGTSEDGFYSIRKLGAFGSDLGAIACFFTEPWFRVSTALSEAAQAWLFNQAAFCLRAMGRLVEAIEPMRAGLELEANMGHWEKAAIGAGNLSELELTLGVVAGAVADAKHSVTYADRSGDEFWKMGTRTTHADALHQAGYRDEAEERFREAERMQEKNQPIYPLLYSLQGFRYCDLLLAEIEREAAKKVRSSVAGSWELELVNACSSVKQRVEHTLNIAENNNWLLDIALDHLTLGRGALYRAILEQANFRQPSAGLFHIENAVTGLRRAGVQDYLLRGLLTRAWLRWLTGLCTGHDSAQADLDEAWEIAERGPMPLFMADIHLYRARLFGEMKDEGGMMKYPWQSPQHDLAEARRLIEKHGYLRRMGELEDAEAAIKPECCDAI